MPKRYAEGTEVPVERSRAEVEQTLKRYGATEFLYGWAARSLAWVHDADQYHGAWLALLERDRPLLCAPCLTFGAPEGPDVEGYDSPEAVTVMGGTALCAWHAEYATDFRMVDHWDHRRQP